MSIPTPRIPLSPQADAPREDREPGLDNVQSDLTVQAGSDGWLVKTANGDPVGVTPTKAEAVQMARDHAAKAGTDVTVER